MKKIFRWEAFTMLFVWWLFSFSSCNSEGVSENDPISQKIDSLIEIQKVNNHCILITFGGDAVTAIGTKNGIVVVDAGSSSGLTARYRKIIVKVFQRNDFAYVINTHGHPDHNGGNNVFPEARVIGHVNSLQEIAQQWNNPKRLAERLNKIVAEYELQLRTTEPNSHEWNEIFSQKTRYLCAYDDAMNLVSTRPPDFTFSDSLNIDMGDAALEMFYFGKCHSNSDIFLYVSGLKMLFIGDLFFKYGRPSINDTLMTDKDRWKQAIGWIDRRIPYVEKVITGHGRILSVDDLESFSDIILRKCSVE